MQTRTPPDSAPPELADPAGYAAGEAELQAQVIRAWLAGYGAALLEVRELLGLLDASEANRQTATRRARALTAVLRVLGLR